MGYVMPLYQLQKDFLTQNDWLVLYGDFDNMVKEQF
jgi:hypothetical protein